MRGRPSTAARGVALASPFAPLRGQAALYAADQFRISDHDPVVVGLDLLNYPPVVGPITAPATPVQVGTLVTTSAPFSDPDKLDTHTAAWDWGDGTTSAGAVSEANGAGTVSGSHAYAVPGIYSVQLTVQDNFGNADTEIFEYVVVYDPNGGFVTGGGWIDSPAGAYMPDPTLAGKATFGFVSRYQKGASRPTGNTEFQFRTGGLNFKSTSYDWLVVSGATAKYKGLGAIDGQGSYPFMLWAGDGAPDTFRIKIWWEDAAGEHVIYDNGSSQALGGGSIVVHK